MKKQKGTSKDRRAPASAFTPRTRLVTVGRVQRCGRWDGNGCGLYIEITEPMGGRQHYLQVAAHTPEEIAKIVPGARLAITLNGADPHVAILGTPLTGTPAPEPEQLLLILDGRAGAQ